MQKKLKQTSLAVVLIVLITFGVILLLQNFVNNDYGASKTKKTTQPSISVSPEKGPDDESSLNDVVQENPAITPEEKCAQMTDENSKLNCLDNLILKEVLEANVLLACEDLQYQPNIQYCQDVFYKNKALVDMDLAICDEIQDEYIKSQCKDAVLLKVGTAKLSLEECEKITDTNQKGLCIDKVRLTSAINNGDINQCGLLEDQTLEEICVKKAKQKASSTTYTQAVESKNPVLCNDLEDVLKNECQDSAYYQKGVEDNDPSACQQIQEEAKQTECLLNVYLVLAKEQEDPGLCANINKKDDRVNCEQNINLTLLKKALVENDAQKCDLISDEVLKTKCQSSV